MRAMGIDTAILRASFHLAAAIDAFETDGVLSATLPGTAGGIWARVWLFLPQDPFGWTV